MVFIQCLILMSTILPFFHIINAVLSSRKTIINNDFIKEEQKFTIIIPCYNEATVIPVSISGVINLNYRNYEVIYVNDGSTDNTFDVLMENLNLVKCPPQNIDKPDAMEFYASSKYNNIYVISKANQGKGQSLNTGIIFANSELIVTLDADSVLEENALNHMNRAFLDKQVVAAGGTINILQGYTDKYTGNQDAKKEHRSGNQYTKKTRRLISLQILDYLKGFFIYKFSLSAQNATAVISGAFGVFRRDVLIAVNGYRKTLGEDIDITLRIQFYIQKTKQKILYLPQAVCFTQCPETWKDLRTQRLRWQKGFINCISYYRKQILKTFLFRSLTFHLFIEAFIIGITSSYFTIFTIIYVIIARDLNVLIIFGWYFLFRILFQTIYSVVSIHISQKYYYYPKTTLRNVALVIALDFTIFQFFTMFMYLLGILSYFWYAVETQSWNKFNRSQHANFTFGNSLNKT